MDAAVQRLLTLGGALATQVHELLLELYPAAVLTADSENVATGPAPATRA
jgi:hypothetical protein